MARYVVFCKEMSLEEARSQCEGCGARNLRVAQVSRQIFCDLEEADVQRLRQTPGLTVRPVERVTPALVAAPPVSTPTQPVYAGFHAVLASAFWEARETLNPPLTGQGYTICILDTGIRKTHRGLVGKVVYEVNLTNSLTAEDVFDHGTGVAWMAAGGRHAPGEESGTAPGASLWNIKVLNDEGEGTVEDIVIGLEHVIELRQQAITEGLPNDDPLFPNIINMSFGTPDDGDPDNPLRVASRAALEAGFGVVAAAGNAGPGASTIMAPAAEPWVVAVGALTLSPFDVWEYSGRGPTREGFVKPDLVFYGVDLLTASSKSDTAFEIKSGTSFAAPYVAGIGALGQEAARRILGYWVTEEQALQMVLPFTVKPPGAPLEKDNAYGLGMPFGTLLKQAMERPGQAGIMDTALPLMGMAMMGMMMSGVTRRLRG